MPCGCVDNKNLNKDKLSLELMQTLSIDEIINLYRQGYTLEESENFTDIRSLALSFPNVQYAAAASGIPSAGKIRITWIWSNTGAYGYGKFKFYTAGTSTLIGETPSCCYNTGPSPLYRLSTFDITSSVSALDIVTYRCNSDTQQNCPAGSDPSCTGTCSAVVEASRFSYVDALGYGTQAPLAPSTLTITPGNGSLTFSWSEVTNTSILGYHIVIKIGGTTVTDGYWSQNVGPVVISGLTNGTSHSVSISAVSSSNVEGTAKTGSGTPSLPTPVLTTIAVTPTIASVNVGATQQLAVVCKDQNGTVMTCPTLTWLSSDTLKATVNSSGLVTGVAAGSANITASASGVTSNTSAITVNPLTCTAITNVSASPNPVTQGQTTTLTATTTPAIAGFNVAFKDGATILSTQTTNSSGIATYPWPTAGQSTGAHSITASVGTPAQCTSISATTVTISPPSCTSITLFASPTSVTVGETVTLTATTNPAIAGFNVAFKDGATTLQTVTTNSSGVAIYQWNTAGQGTGAHPLTASVAGQCTSSMTTVTISTVQQNCTAITNVSASPNPVTQGQTTTLTATTTPAIAGFNVVFKDGATTLQTVTTNSSGIATYPWPTAGQSIGAHSITASVGTPAQCTSLSATTVTITTVAQVLTSISPASATIQINTTQQFTAKDQNGNTIATGVAWARTAGVGSINTTGLYSAGPTDGTATISATYGGVTKTAPVTVTTTPPPQAGGGGAMMIAAVAAIAIAYFMMRKPPTGMK